MSQLKLILRDGTEVTGESFGYYPESHKFEQLKDWHVDGEVVFNTGMVGYPESLTDPSYCGQILVLTYPLIGNYGVPLLSEKNDLSDLLESNQIHVRGLIVSEYCKEHSHWQASRSLSDWLKKHKIPAIQGIDTRALTQKLREHGVMLGKITHAEAHFHKGMKFSDPNETNLVAEVSCKEKKVYKPKGKPLATVAAYDCGMKHNIIRSFLRRGVKVIRLPWDYDIKKLKGDWDALFVSNGPGDPKMADKTIESMRYGMLETKKPVFGICLGTQLMALATGGNTYKLKYGHRSANQPCVDSDTKKCYITSQNHGFAVDESSLPKEWEIWFRNANDGTIEGIKHKNRPWFSVQFHPDASPGPEDTAYLFDYFLKRIGK